MSTWFAVDADGRVAAFEITTFGARPAVALRLVELSPEEQEGWWAPDGAALLRFQHDTGEPGGWYDRSGGDGTVRLEDVPESVRDRVVDVTFPGQLDTLERLDLVAALPGQLLLGEEATGDGATGSLEMMGLFDATGPRMRVGRNRDRLERREE
ncbi:MAG: hypothetical protein ACI8PZ_006675 [Myxococcota bacterium]|jgi:hypothetical protein